MARAILYAVLYPAYMNEMAGQLNSADDFLAMEAQVHLKLAKGSKNLCDYLNYGISPNRQNLLTFDVLW